MIARPSDHPIVNAMRWCGWHPYAILVLGLVLSLVAMARPASAQRAEPACLSFETVTAQFNTRGYTFGCVPDNWQLYHMADEVWHTGAQTLSGVRPVQRYVFVSQFAAGHYDDYVLGHQPPDWQDDVALQWQRDFAGIGYRSVANGSDTAQVIPVFLIAMWAGGSLDVETLTTTLASRTDEYATIELASLTLHYLDGDETIPPQVAYVLDGTQMQELFNLDSAFLNSQHVIIQPTEATQALGGIPVFTFFSSSPITVSDLEPLLQSLQFRHSLPPVEPDPALVTNLHTPLGLLELVPVLRDAAAALVAAWRAEIQADAIAFAREMPYTHLLPFQLLTSDTRLYWAPEGLQTGRLILWHYTGGAHGNSDITSWTFTTQDVPVTLSEILTLSADETLALITDAAIKHLMAAGMSETESQDWVTEGLTELADVTAWNPALHQGREGLWITLEPYVITPYYMGIQEFFVPMALQLPH